MAGWPVRTGYVDQAQRQNNQALRKKLSRAVPQFTNYTGGDMTTSSTSYVNVVSGSDTVRESIAATPGDIVQLNVSSRWSAAATVKRLDAMTTGGSHYISGGSSTTTGVAAWGGLSGAIQVIGGSVYYVVHADAVVNGVVTFTLRAKMNSAVSGVLSASDPILQFGVKNHGQ
jgi:hypothetical protein